jgi:hypothetical protein
MAILVKDSVIAGVMNELQSLEIKVTFVRIVRDVKFFFKKFFCEMKHYRKFVVCHCDLRLYKFMCGIFQTFIT